MAMKQKKDTNAQVAYRIKQELETHRQAVDQLSQAVLKQAMNIKYAKRELAILKTLDDSMFETLEPKFKYETEPEYVAMQKGIRLDSTELSIQLTEDKQAKDEESLALEKAKVAILESGREFYGLSDEEILAFDS